MKFNARKTACILAVLLAVSFFMQWQVVADSLITPRQRVIRVSCPLQDGFFEIDEKGNYSGYTYEYLMKVAQRTGWRYEFDVYPSSNDNLADALNRLKTGEIDIMTSMVYNETLAEEYSFTSVPYGQSELTLMADVNNERINQRTYDKQLVLRVALNEKSTATNQQLDDFFNEHDILYEPIYTDSAQRPKLVQAGEADVFISKNIVPNEGFKTVAKFATEPFYFATAKENTALTQELSRIMTEMQEADPYYTAKLHDQYFRFESNFKLSLTAEEQEYLKTIPAIKIVVLTEREPVQGYDPETGSYHGIIIDIIQKTAEETGVKIKFIPADSVADAKRMLEQGEADAFAGFPYSYPYADQYNLLLTSPIFTMPVVRLSNVNGLGENEETLVSSSIKLFDGQDDILYVEEISEIFKLVNSGKYKQAYVNGYIAQYYLRTNVFANTLLMQTPYSNYALCIGVSRRADTHLVSILEQMISKSKLLNMEDIVYQNTAYTYDLSLIDVMKRNPVEFMMPVLLIFVLLSTLLCVMVIKTRRLNKLISKEKSKYQEISTKDALAQTYNNDTFKRLTREYLINEPYPTGTLLICDIDKFKGINDTYGHGMGDNVIHALGEILLTLFSGEHLVGRLGGDEFVVLIKNVTEPAALEQACIELLKQSAEISSQFVITLSIGCTVFSGKTDFEPLFEEADKALYTVKNRGRNGFEICWKTAEEKGNNN